MDIKNKVRQMACGAAFALSQAGTALAADGNETKSGFTISGAFSSVISGVSSSLQTALQYAFDNVSSAAWGALVLGILLIVIKAGLSHFSTDSNPADAARHETALTGILRIAAIAVVAVGIIYMLHQKFA
jgi:hypothetical protein